jgi:hypothetical protein
MDARPERKPSLCLDDYLEAVEDMRRRFALPIPEVGLKEIEKYAAARNAIEEIVKATLKRHAYRIYSKPHSIFGNVDNQIYSERIETSAYSGFKIHPNCIDKTLRRAIEVGLQTVVQLPPRDPSRGYRSRQLKSLALALGRCAKQLSVALQSDEVRERLKSLPQKERDSKLQLWQLDNEMQRAADVLQAVATLRVARVKMGSPNPQVRFEVYFVGWIQACTGSQRYETVATLIAAAFAAAHKRTPPWLERLAIERHSQSKHRKKWIRQISS